MVPGEVCWTQIAMMNVFENTIVKEVAFNFSFENLSW